MTAHGELDKSRTVAAAESDRNHSTDGGSSNAIQPSPPAGKSKKAKKPRRSLRAFLTPGWIISVLLIASFSYLAITILAPWQLNKDDSITTRNHQISEAFNREVVPYSEVFDSAGTVPEDKEWYRVSLTGHYLPDSEVLLRLRPVDGTPAFHSLVPFALDSGQFVLVNRGFEPSSGTIVPEIKPAPQEPVTIVGVARKNENNPAGEPLKDGGYDQVYAVNTNQVSEITGIDLGLDYVQLSGDQPGVLNPQPIPQLDRGNHLSYGFQWIAFGIMAPIGLGYFIWAEMRERRREKAEIGELPEADTPEEPETTELDKTPETVSSQARQRSRYGDQHRNYYRHAAEKNEERF